MKNKLVKVCSLLRGLCKFKRLSLQKKIFCSSGSIVNMAKSSHLSLGGNLWFGMQATNDGFFFYGDRTQLILSSGSRMKAKGSCTIGGGTLVWLDKKANLEIGDKTYFNRNCSLYIAKSIKIGERCAIGWNVTIVDTDFHPLIKKEEEGIFKQAEAKEVVIEDHVWVGSNTTILKGVKIGKGAVVAAGSVVRDDVPANSLVAGNPAQIIKKDVSWVL